MNLFLWSFSSLPLIIQEGLLSVTSESILTSTKNASLIITDFSAMIYKNEQPRTASLCRGWPILKNDFNFDMQETRYSDDVIQAQRTHDGIVHRSLMISI